MKTLAAAVLLSFTLSALAEGTFDCHVKILGHIGHLPEVAGSLEVTSSHITFTSESGSMIFETSSRQSRSKRGGFSRWNQFSLVQDGIITKFTTDTEETMNKVTIDSTRGSILIGVQNYFCFKIQDPN